MPYTFSGGVKVPFRKDVVNCAVERLKAPAEIRVPLRQCGEEECFPTVRIGERVNKGQEIGKCKDGTGCPVHSGISGTVRDIVSVSLPDRRESGAIVIENDYEDRLDPSVYPFGRSIKETTPEQILETARLKGICGNGREPLPLYRRIQCSLGKARRVIVNCTECEPFLSANRRLVLEQPEKIIGGAQILLKALGVRCGHLAVEDCFSEGMKALLKSDFDPDMFRICLVKSKYPQSDPRLLVAALFGREILSSSSLADSGYAVFDAVECAALYDAFVSGMPMVERIVTVGGDGVAEPANLSCPIGTPLENILLCCGLSENCTLLLAGGSFSGVEVPNAGVPLVKNIPAVLAFNEAPERGRSGTDCIRCGRCVSACPMKLLPLELYRAACKENLPAAERYLADCCSGCGCCSFVCPAGLDLTDKILKIQGMLAEDRKKKQSSNGQLASSDQNTPESFPKAPENAENDFAKDSSENTKEAPTVPANLQSTLQSPSSDFSVSSEKFTKEEEEGHA